MIDLQQRRNPLHWALLMLLVGIAFSLLEPIPQLKFQTQSGFRGSLPTARSPQLLICYSIPAGLIS